MSKRLANWLVVIAGVVAQSCSATSPAVSVAALEREPPGFESAPRIGTSPATPRFVKREEPHFPLSLAGVNAAVTADVYVSEAGEVVGTRYVNGDQRLFPSVAVAAAHWRFEPLSINGEARRWVLPLTCTLTWHGNPPSALLTLR